ncbi:hypothetical protein OQ968_02815 [Mycobacterium sp. 663a-19]|uniref:hypothetical protein n=1 Tax=Mycobacterium sp. 663a-19 TaxID=2986148 RepID=UPI002D1F058F|nr:hypothetical protein [Mycobacterium sp. 663a-19]MEB3980192.1 hypothetical protein [Mycobacterium sp. 663a-19]
MELDRGYIQELESWLVGRAAEGLQQDGLAPRPQVHFILEDHAQPHVGYVISRRYQRGADAYGAITDLGCAAAALCASRLVVMWEECDLRASLYGPGEHPDGIVTVDATLNGHILTWRPYDIRLGPVGPYGAPTVWPKWGRVSQLPDAELPPAINELLNTWRTYFARLDTTSELAGMQRLGYEFRWLIHDEHAG